MAQEIKMPSAGQTTDDAVIMRLNVKVGDSVKRGDVLVEAETDKAVLPVESYAVGAVLEIRVAVGDHVTAGDVLLVVGKPGEAPPAAEATPQAVTPPAPQEDDYLPIAKGRQAPAPATPAPAAAVPAMPGAKLLARELGVDIGRVAPSNGAYIKRRDVEAFARSAPAAAESDAAYEVLPMTRTRSVIAKRMLESTQTIPAWQATVSVDMTACISLRETFLQKRDVKLSYNDILAKAIAVAAEKYPLLRARFENGELRVYRHTNVGLAVGLEGALVVPVVREIDALGLQEIATAYREAVAKAREGRLTPADMGCGSVTISNLGMYDIDHFVAIVNPPESCILAVGKIAVQPVWDGAAFVPVQRMSITGSFDHRIIDGAYGAQFLQELKRLLEAPVLLLG